MELPFNIRIYYGPTSFMKFFIGENWSGSRDVIEYIRKFKRFVASLQSDMPIDDYMKIVLDRINLEKERARSPAVLKYLRHVESYLHEANKKMAQTLSDKYHQFFDNFKKSKYYPILLSALEILTKAGVSPITCEVLCTTYMTAGSAVLGEYVSETNNIIIQIDVISSSKHREIKFMFTLLHELIHCAIWHKVLSKTGNEYHLDWLEELTCTAVSYGVLKDAIRDSRLSENEKRQLLLGLGEVFKEQKEYLIASYFLEQTRDYIIAWRIWEEISKLDPEKIKQYGRKHIINPILKRVGWNIELPHTFKKDGLIISLPVYA